MYMFLICSASSKVHLLVLYERIVFTTNSDIWKVMNDNKIWKGLFVPHFDDVVYRTK